MAGPIKKILIANRGEIALRITRAARILGIRVAGVYTAPDMHSPWIEQYDEAMSLGDGPLSETYLNISKVIEIAVKTNADAVHPGYGFLSENFLFAQACRDHHLIFIGPSPEVLKLMGDKLASHEWVEKLKIRVPVMITGTLSQLSDLKKKLDYPVIVKAAAGGGGKGMRRVHNPGELPDVLRTTSDEASQYFGDNRIYIEGYIPEARHVEVQILGDHHGNLVHLYERECSIQRRHQKVIEEAPAAFLSEELRNDILQAALKISGSVHYTNAGTVEFLIDDKGRYHFLEMNPRIQVEHGITEMITGIDIVKEQITIADGKPLSFSQKEIQYTGHAIEARIYAEDPENDLFPSPGSVGCFIPPLLPGLRLETAAAKGAAIHPDFDPMMAKILVHSATREQAIVQMQQVVQNFVITGIRHNLPFLHEILHDSGFLRNEMNTGYLDHKMGEFKASLLLRRKSVNIAYLGIVATLHVLNRNAELQNDSPWRSGFWRNIRQIRFRYGTQIIEFDYQRDGKDTVIFYYNDKIYRTRYDQLNDDQQLVIINDEIINFYSLAGQDGLIEISDGQLDYVLEKFSILPDPHFHSPWDDSSGHSDNMVLAPQPGTIMDIKVAEGQMVERGDYLLTIESMKLENTIMAGRPGTIKRITIKTGDKVKKNEPLIYLQETINN